MDRRTVSARKVNRAADGLTPGVWSAHFCLSVSNFFFSSFIFTLSHLKCISHEAIVFNRTVSFNLNI